MLDWFLTFVDEPERLIDWGFGTFGFGAAGIVVELIGRVVRGAHAVVQAPGQSFEALWPSLAEILPQLWTWSVPESLLGAVPYVLVAALGIWMVLTGRKFKRLFH